MIVRGFVEKTRNDYVRHVRDFATFVGRATDTAKAEDLRRFQLKQTEDHVGIPTINGAAVPVHDAWFHPQPVRHPDPGAPGAGGSVR